MIRKRTNVYLKDDQAHEAMSSSNSTKTVLILLILVPILINLYVPLYNRQDPTLDGIPFFYWFQTLMLAISTLPYLAFSYIERSIERKTGPEVHQGRAVK
jgi:Protein of unknown function (DUF3311)